VDFLPKIKNRKPSPGLAGTISRSSHHQAAKTGKIGDGQGVYLAH